MGPGRSSNRTGLNTHGPPNDHREDPRIPLWAQSWIAVTISPVSNEFGRNGVLMAGPQLGRHRPNARVTTAGLGDQSRAVASAVLSAGAGLIGSAWWVAPGRMVVVAAGIVVWIFSAVRWLSCTLLCSARMTVVCAVSADSAVALGRLGMTVYPLGKSATPRVMRSSQSSSSGWPAVSQAMKFRSRLPVGRVSKGMARSR